MARFCPNCGTEAEDTAVFCPTCGQAIDQATETEIPAAPAWPEQPPADAEPPGGVEAAVDDAWASRYEEPTQTQMPPAPTAEAPAPPASPAPAPPPPAAQRSGGPVERSAPPVSLPVTMPLTLSAWLIGGGAVIAALGVLIGLFGFLRPIDLILLLVLAAIAATVFFSASVPEIPNLRLVTLVIVLLAFGMAIDRIMSGGVGIGELLFFVGAGAAAIGAILLELGRDQPLGGPQS
ncbi:MAG: zinc-ribbon domain-containing protein [Chloroflexota bacterium]|nr:zinc-ribbon domain-containing protein [Chloroflexota bacterium]